MWDDRLFRNKSSLEIQNKIYSFIYIEGEALLFSD